MVKKTKDMLIEELKNKVEFYQGCCDKVNEHNAKLIGRADDAFANSVDKRQLEQECDFYKNLADLNSNLYDAIKARSLKQSENLRRVYEDNKNLAESTCIEYVIGMTASELTSEQIAYEDIEEENRRLKAKLENREEKIELLMKEIKNLQWEVAALNLSKIA